MYSPYGFVCTSGIFREVFLQLHDSWVNYFMFWVIKDSPISMSVTTVSDSVGMLLAVCSQ